MQSPSMEKGRIPFQVEPSPESYYYQQGKLGVLTNPGDMQEYDGKFISTRKWAIILGS